MRLRGSSKLLFWSLILVASVSYAVIRVGTGGGGLAEMQVVSIHQNLNQYIFVCLQNQNPCQLSLNEFNEYRELYNRQEMDSRRFPFVFSGQLSNGKIYEMDQNRVSINSRALYDQNSEPLEFRQLLSLVIAIRLDLLPSQNSIQKNYSRALHVFQSLSPLHQSRRVTGLSRFLMIHLYDIRFANTRNLQLYLEDEEKTHDLTLLLNSRIPCGRLNEWRIQNWKSMIGRNEVFFMAETWSSCLTQKSRVAHLVLKVNLDSKSRVQPETAQIQFRF